MFRAREKASMAASLAASLVPVFNGGKTAYEDSVDAAYQIIRLVEKKYLNEYRLEQESRRMREDLLIEDMKRVTPPPIDVGQG